MNSNSYSISISVHVPQSIAASGIMNARAWWAQDIETNPEKTGDRFTVHFGKTWATFEVTECNDRRIIWAVTDCYLDLLDNTKEWKYTHLIFTFKSKEGKTVIDITHEGLTPDKQCYNDCCKGWNFYFGESLQPWLEKSMGQPGEGIHAWLETEGSILKGRIYTPEQKATEMSGDLLLLDVKQTRGEQVQAAYALRSFRGDTGELKGAYYMLIPNEPGAVEKLQRFVGQTI